MSLRFELPRFPTLTRPSAAPPRPGLRAHEIDTPHKSSTADTREGAVRTTSSSTSDGFQDHDLDLNPAKQSWSIRPGTFAGTCGPGNERALDWSDNRHLAYGARTSVVIVEQDPLRVVQTLDEHRFNVCCLKW